MLQISVVWNHSRQEAEEVNTETIMTIALFLVLLGAAILVMVQNNRAGKRYLLNRIKKDWGSVPDREYSYEELDSIAKYGKRIQGDRFYIDDTTWNDLDMERIFMLMNHTMSSCGEDYLYAMLRLPRFDRETLEERERLTEYFRHQEKERGEMQLILAKIGKIKDLSITDYIYRMNQVERKRRTKYFVQAGLSVAAIVTMFLNPLAGVGFFLGMTVLNVTTHYKDSAAIEPYFKCLTCILRVLQAADALKKRKIPELDGYLRTIEKDVAAMKGIRKKARLLANSKGVDDALSVLTSYLNSFFLLDFIEFYGALKEYDGHQKEIEELIEQIGILDSAIAVASFRAYLPFYAVPEFGKHSPVSMEVKNLYHPLISEPVANSISVSGGTLVTGSNASGKSTFLKNIAVNAILSQTIYTCTASEYRADMVKVMTSMALRDDLQGGESYYIVEIKSIKRILDEAAKGAPLLCIVDEVLRGTNTIERIAASSRILHALNQSHVLAFAATHDIELSYILEGFYENYHFEEEISEDDVKFNYLLKSGRATSRNAIALLEMIGYDKQIVSEARQAAKDFEDTGIWKGVNRI